MGKTVLADTKVWSWSSNDVDSGGRPDNGAQLFETFDPVTGQPTGNYLPATILYGQGDKINPIAQSEGSTNESYLFTDYTQSYDQNGSTKNMQAPTATGWSLAFDGTSIATEADGTPTNFGYTRSDISQQFDNAIWQNASIARLSNVVSRSYTSDAAGDGSYDQPVGAPDAQGNPPIIATIDGSWSRSYTATSYVGSYDEQTGKINRDTPPQVLDGYSLSFDGQHTYTRSDIEQDFALLPWSNLGKTVLNDTRVWSWSSNNIPQNDAAPYNDGNRFATFNQDGTISGYLPATVLYGQGDRNDPVAQSEGSTNESYLFTDYSQSYDQNGSTKNMSAPIAQGWSLAFDGTAVATEADGTPTNFGYTKSDIFQQFDDAIWQNASIARLSNVVSRSYTSDAAGDGSYDQPVGAPDVNGNPAIVTTVDGSWSRSYTTTSYAGSYDEQTGKINRSTPPTVLDGYSLSFDGQHTYTRSDIDQDFAPLPWSNLGKTVLADTKVWSWSSDNISQETYSDDGDFVSFDEQGRPDGDLGATEIFGDGDRNDPVAQSEGSESTSYLLTDYSLSYDQNGSTKNMQAPTAEGTSWSFDGTSLQTRTDGTATNFGYTKSDIDQQFNNAIWQNAGVARLETVISRSYTSDFQGDGSYDKPVGWQDPNDGTFPNGSTADQSWSRSYTATSYDGSYDINGRIVRDQAPTVRNGYSLSFDGQHTYTQSQLEQDFLAAAWADLGKTVLAQTRVWSWSSDDAPTANGPDDNGQFAAFGDDGSVIGYLPATTFYGEGDFNDPWAQADGSMNKSYVLTDYTNAYDPTTWKPWTNAAPVANGYSWSFDGTALDPTRTNFGFTKSDIYQQFDANIWGNAGVARLAVVDTRSYTSDAAGDGSYDVPFADTADHSWSRSYTETNYVGSYDENGKIVRASPPQVRNGYSLAFDGEHTYTQSKIEQDFSADAWADLGKTVLQQTRTWTWSSDNAPQTTYSDDGHFVSFDDSGQINGDLGATTIYGGGSFDDPLAQVEGSMSNSYLVTDYSGAYDPQSWKPWSDQAPTATGWSWSFDGTAVDPDNTNFGFTKSIINQVFNATIWGQSGVARLLTVTSHSFSSDRDGALDGQGGTFDDPIAAVDGSYSRSYSSTDYSNSYDINGKIIRQIVPDGSNPDPENQTGVPTVVGYSYSFDGLHTYTKTDTAQTFNGAVWYWLGKTVLLDTITTSWSTTGDKNPDGTPKTFASDEFPGEPTVYGDGSFNNPTAQDDGSMSVSYLDTSYLGSYDDQTSRTDFAGAVAPTATGYSWSFDGTAVNPDQTNYGFTKTDIYQSFNLGIWENAGIARLETVISRSYSSDQNGYLSGQGGTYDNPVPAIDGSYSRSYTVTSYAGSYDENGHIVRAQLRSGSSSRSERSNRRSDGDGVTVIVSTGSTRTQKRKPNKPSTAPFGIGWGKQCCLKQLPTAGPPRPIKMRMDR